MTCDTVWTRYPGSVIAVCVDVEVVSSDRVEVIAAVGEDSRDYTQALLSDEAWLRRVERCALDVAKEGARAA